MEPTWGPPGSCRPQMAPMLSPWTLLSGWVFLLGCSKTGWRLAINAVFIIYLKVFPILSGPNIWPFGCRCSYILPVCIFHSIGSISGHNSSFTHNLKTKMLLIFVFLWKMAVDVKLMINAKVPCGPTKAIAPLQHFIQFEIEFHTEAQADRRMLSILSDSITPCSFHSNIYSAHYLNGRHGFSINVYKIRMNKWRMIRSTGLPYFSYLFPDRWSLGMGK